MSRNYPDGKWRIVCDKRPGDVTYRSRDEAARAERDYAASPWGTYDGNGKVSEFQAKMAALESSSI
ncbi:hypothetical protein [Arthrobacter sp. 31Y]|uniref:hypothetical protein n=1 Tax=Arthrobacter sp. 31Y TaxID=1115632 RepID=UPI000463AFFB|nr:hypothetical protein [Arthrobacter sp. 31Y]